MAAKKKAKAKTQVKRKKTPARKPAVRKKTAPKKAAAKKPAAKKKPAARRAAPKKQAPARRAAPKKKPVPRPSPRPRPAPIPPQPAAAAPPAPLPGEERVGSVTHYYGHLAVAAVRLDSGSLRVGDAIRVLGHTSDFRQRVESMQIEHQAVSEAGAGEEIGLRVTGHAREGDVVYKAGA